MGMCICGESAKRLLDSLGDEALARALPIDADDFVWEVPTPAEAHDIAASIWGDPDTPIDVLVRRSGGRARNPSATFRVWSSRIPPKSLAMLDDGTVVTTPWFELILDASGLDAVVLCKRIMDMTSIYRTDETSEDGFVEHEPMISGDALTEYLSSCKGIHGAKRVFDALDWCPPRARSPREADLSLVLCMPRKFGGCGLPAPRLNHEVELGGAARRILGQRRCVIDLYWEVGGKRKRRSGVEYLGEFRHPEIGKDLARVYALRHEGIPVHLVANRQFKDAAQILMLVEDIAGDLGLATSARTLPHEEDLQKLIERVDAP